MNDKNMDLEDKNPDNPAGYNIEKSSKNGNEGVSHNEDINSSGRKPDSSEPLSSHNSFPDSSFSNNSFSNEPAVSTSSENIIFNKNSSYNPPNGIPLTSSSPSQSPASNKSGTEFSNTKSNPFPQKKKVTCYPLF